MKINKNSTETIVKPEKSAIDDFFVAFNKNYANISNDNLVIDFSELKGINAENILKFLQHSKTHKCNRASFVIVANGIDYDSLPEELIVVPTVNEAKDVIEMEEIERDLGF